MHLWIVGGHLRECPGEHLIEGKEHIFIDERMIDKIYYGRYDESVQSLQCFLYRLSYSVHCLL